MRTTVQLQLSFVEIIFRLPLEKSWIKIEFPIIFNTFKVFPIFIIKIGCNCAVAAQLQLVK